MSGQFGKRVRDLRVSKKVSLRQFCIDAKVDPSNWSKVERGLLAPPTELDDITAVLGIEQGSADWHELTNLAYLEKGMIPKGVLEDDEVMAALPIFFRTARGEKPNRAELEQIIEVIKRS